MTFHQEKHLGRDVYKRQVHVFAAPESRLKTEKTPRAKSIANSGIGRVDAGIAFLDEDFAICSGGLRHAAEQTPTAPDFVDSVECTVLVGADVLLVEMCIRDRLYSAASR